MVKIRQTGQNGLAQRLAAAFGIGLTLLTGCSTTPTAAPTQTTDPLHGHRAPPGIPVPDSHKPPGTPTTLSPSYGSPGLTPVGSEFSSSNNATLAGLSGGTPLGRPLAIDDQGRTLAPGQLTAGQKTAQTPTQLSYPAPNANPKVEAIPDAGYTPAPSKFTPSGWQIDQPGTPTAPTPTTPTVPTTATPSTAEALTRQLQERGVVNQKLDSLSQGVHLTCYVSRGGDGGLRILEVTAVDYPTAAQAILQQLDTAR